MCTSKCEQVYTYVQPYLTKGTLVSNIKGKRQLAAMLSTVKNTYAQKVQIVPAPLTMFRVRVRHERLRTGLPRETTYVITARDNVCDHCERLRT